MLSNETYATHCQRRMAYGWQPLDWLTWASWRFGVPLATMKSDPCDDWSPAFPAEWRDGRLVYSTTKHL